MRGRGRAGSPLSQFEQQADEITQVVVARLTNEHEDRDENNKTGRGTFRLLTVVGDDSGRESRLIYILHYIIFFSLSLSSVSHEHSEPSGNRASYGHVNVFLYNNNDHVEEYGSFH